MAHPFEFRPNPLCGDKFVYRHDLIARRLAEVCFDGKGCVIGLLLRLYDGGDWQNLEAVNSWIGKQCSIYLAFH
jgi:hypothetical protein